jgi:acyl dehydratase
MLLRAAATLIPRSRPATLPSTVLHFTASSKVDTVAAYNAVCGFPLTDFLPATYPHILAFGPTMQLMSGNDFPFPVVGLIHVANSVSVRTPIPLGASVDFTVQAADLRPHHRGKQFDIVTTAALDGSVAWEETSTYLRRGSAVGAASPAEDALLEGPPAAVWHVGSAIGRQYAAVSGDHNPIHTSRLGARAFGFRRPIAHGMWTLARLLAAVTPMGAFEVEARFRAPIFLGTRVELRTSARSAEVRSSTRVHMLAEFS